MKTFNSIREETLEEKLKASDPAGKYISDFVHSDNPKFAGKSKKERIRMALGASYGAKKTNEAKDSREYDYEGDMAKSQLRSIIANAQTVHDMLEDNTNLAEWVQSKITLSADYISTVRDYMQSNKDVNEEVDTSEVEHHHDEWMNSEHRPYQSDAGNDPKIHKQALRYLSTTDVPKEKHEELAMHIADKFHGSGIDEEVEQIDEISTKTLAKAAKSASDPDSDYYYGKSHDPQKFADHAKKTKDAKSAAAVQGAADAKSHYARPGHTLGSYDKLANRTPARVTSAGKANKQDVKTLKGNIQRNEEVEITHENPLVVAKDSEGNIHTHADLGTVNAILGTNVKHQAIHTYKKVQDGKFTLELSKHHASSVNKK